MGPSFKTHINSSKAFFLKLVNVFGCPHHTYLFKECQSLPDVKNNFNKLIVAVSVYVLLKFPNVTYLISKVFF